MKRGATDLERAEETLMHRRRSTSSGELIRNELDDDRDAWRSRADLRRVVG
jgi:hypothetical protein